MRAYFQTNDLQMPKRMSCITWKHSTILTIPSSYAMLSFVNCADVGSAASLPLPSRSLSLVRVLRCLRPLRIEPSVLVVVGLSCFSASVSFGSALRDLVCLKTEVHEPAASVVFSFWSTFLVLLVSFSPFSGPGFGRLWFPIH
jgi:hypothetical protein